MKTAMFIPIPIGKEPHEEGKMTHKRPWKD